MDQKPEAHESPESQAARRILAVTEEELQRIVLDIHDGPVQHMFAALSHVRTLQRHCTRGDSIPSEEAEKPLEQISGLLVAAMDEIRTFLGSFRSPDFLTQDLANIIQGLLLQHETFTDCQVEFARDSQPLIATLPIKIALYRICQEALSNSYQHSGADRQRVELRRKDGMITLSISDQGKGFVPPQLSGPTATEDARYIGLRGMRDRMALIGGQFDLETSPSKGVKITVSAPI